MLTFGNFKKYVGYFFVGMSMLCGAIVTIQLAILEINWNYFPTRNYQPGTISGAVDLYHRLVETCQLLMSPTCLPFVATGFVCVLFGKILLDDGEI